MNKAVLKKIIANQIKVTSYLTYEEFLEDFYQEAKKNIKPYSWLEFADDLGLKRIFQLTREIFQLTRLGITLT